MDEITFRLAFPAMHDGYRTGAILDTPVPVTEESDSHEYRLDVSVRASDYPTIAEATDDLYRRQGRVTPILAAWYRRNEEVTD